MNCNDCGMFLDECTCDDPVAEGASELNGLVMPLLHGLNIRRPANGDRIEIQHHIDIDEHPVIVTLEFVSDISDPLGYWIRKEYAHKDTLRTFNDRLVAVLTTEIEMNTDQLLNLVKRAKSQEEHDYDKFCFVFDEDELSRLIAIVAKEEREACKEIADGELERWLDDEAIGACMNISRGIAERSNAELIQWR